MDNWYQISPPDQSIEGLPAITFQWERIGGADDFRVLIYNLCSTEEGAAEETACINSNSEPTYFFRTSEAVQVENEASIELDSICYYVSYGEYTLPDGTTKTGELCNLYVPVPQFIPENRYGYLWFIEGSNEFQYTYGDFYVFSLIDKTPPTVLTMNDCVNYCEDTVELKWQNIGGDTIYNVELFTTSDFSGTACTTFEVNEDKTTEDLTTLITLESNLCSNGDYYTYWRVQGSIKIPRMDTRFETPFNETGCYRHYVLPLPEMVSPAHELSSTNPKPEFSWNSVPEATGYEIVVFDEELDTTVPGYPHSIDSPETNSFTPDTELEEIPASETEPYPTKSYKWQVRTLGECPDAFDLILQPYYRYIQRTLHVPEVLVEGITEPLGPCTGDTCYQDEVTFQWDEPPADNPSDDLSDVTYEYRIANDLVSLEAETTTTISDTTFIYDTSIDASYPPTEYFFQVRTVDKYTESAWSDACHVFGHMTPITLTYPTDGAVDIPDSDSLTWNAMDGVSSYNFYVLLDDSFTIPATTPIPNKIEVDSATYCSGGTCTLPMSEFDTVGYVDRDGRTYYWAVSYETADGLCEAPAGSVWDFTVEDPCGGPDAPNIDVNPIGCYTSTNAFNVYTVTGMTFYQLYKNGSKYGIPRSYSDSLYCGETYCNVLEDGLATDTWEVVACTDFSCTTQGSPTCPFDPCP